MKDTARVALLALVTLVIAAGVVVGSSGGTQDPVGNFNFLVTIEGLEECPVAGVEGFVTETDVIEYRAGKDRLIRKLAGRHHFGNVVIRRGATDDLSWWEWRQAILNGEIERRAVKIEVLNGSSTEVVLRIFLARAWPVAYRISPLDANDSAVLIEELELTVEGIERDS